MFFFTADDTGYTSVKISPTGAGKGKHILIHVSKCKFTPQTQIFKTLQPGTYLTTYA